jgi:alpha-glucosidase
MFNTSVQPAIADDEAKEWWRGASIYQIYPRSFCDSNGDGIGDLPGITSRLSHVASLGVDAVWLSPFFKSPMKDFGYDVSDYRDVDPIFGSLEDFDRLIARARELGLKIIVDQVYSHTSDQHAWFQESRTSRENARADWYIWADAKPDGSPPSNWQSVFGGPAWTWDARRGQYYMHNFLSTQPDLNVHNPVVQEALLATMRFWLDRGVDGFRLDALNFCMHDPELRDNPPATDGGKRTRPFDFQRHVYNQSHPDIPVLLERFRALAEEYDGAFLVAEVGGDEALKEMKLFTEPPNRLQSAYGFNFLTADSLTPALIAESVEQWPSDADEGWPSWTFSNHDAPRAVSRWSAGRDQVRFARMANLLLMSLRGNVFLYQGEELGLPQAEVPFERLQDPEAIANWPQTLGRDGARTPMPWAADRLHAGFSEVEPWLPLDATHRDLSVDVQEADEASTLHFTRRVVALRDRLPVLRTGGVRIVEAGESLLVFERGEGAEAALCAFNLGHEPVEWSAPQGWSVQESVNWDEGGVLQPLAGAVLTQA